MVRASVNMLLLMWSQGQSGLGKSTLVNSLFLTDLYQDAAYPNPAMRIPKTTEVITCCNHGDGMEYVDTIINNAYDGEWSSPGIDNS